MALITKTNTFSAGDTIVASEHNDNFDTIYNEFNGSTDNANIKSGAAIADTKLAQITTASKVHFSAITGGLTSGMILMWSGAISAIPTGWVICDGNNSTPDLSGRFVVHADADSGGTYNPDDTGGQDNMPAHTHTQSRSNESASSGSSAGGDGTQTRTSENTGSTGSGGTADDNRPPYYALAFIMKT